MSPYLNLDMCSPFLLCYWQGCCESALSNIAELGRAASHEQKYRMEITTSFPLLLSGLCVDIETTVDVFGADSSNPLLTVRFLSLLIGVGPFMGVGLY